MIGVLTGIFFSGGEGLRLLPFGPSSQDQTLERQRIGPDDFRSYSASVRTQGSHSIPLKVRAQKDLTYFTGAVSVAFQRRAATSTLVSRRQFREIELSYSSNFLISPSGRAPPRV